MKVFIGDNRIGFKAENGVEESQLSNILSEVDRKHLRYDVKRELDMDGIPTKQIEELIVYYPISINDKWI